MDNWGAQRWNDWGCSNSTRFICERASLPAGSSGVFPEYEASNTASATVNTVQRSIQVFAGQLVTVGTCGLPGAAVASGDTWLRVNNPAAQEVASNDDSCGLASSLSFVAATTGSYTVRQGCYSSGYCKATAAYKIGP